METFRAARLGGPGLEGIYGLYCESEKGEKFIAEMLKAEQKYFKDRSVSN